MAHVFDRGRESGDRLPSAPCTRVRSAGDNPQRMNLTMTRLTRAVCSACAAAALLLTAAATTGCSSTDEKRGKSAFLESLEQDARRDAAEKMKQRQAEEARRKAVEEEARRRWAGEAARAAAPGAAAPAAPAAAGTADGVVYELSDKDLTFLVLNKIRLGYKGSTVSVNCAAGRVELFGQVPTEETRQRLIADVRKLPGVREVVARELFVAP